MPKQIFHHISSRDQLSYFRVILAITAIAYLLFGIVYRFSSPNDFPMSMTQRVFASSFFFLMFVLTFLSEWVKKNIELSMYFAVLVGFSHLIYFSHVNGYRLNYALSILVVIIVINFLFRGDLRLRWFNWGLNIIVLTSVYFALKTPVDKTVYGFAVILTSYLSFALSRAKHKTQEEYEQLFQDSPIGLIQCSSEGEIQDFNKEMLRIAGNPSKEQFQGLNAFGLLDISKEGLKSVGNREKLLVLPWGREVWVEYSIELIPGRGKSPAYIIVACKDISHRKAAEDKLEYITYHDNLTDLYNRSFFQKAVERLGPKERSTLSIMFVDVDKLKLVNDAFGHEVGDRLLKRASELIVNSCRNSDVVFRWGGDEIVILLPDTTRQESENVRERIQNRCSDAGFEPVGISLSVGLATDDGRTQDLHDLIQQAENEMYRTKIKKEEQVDGELLATIMSRLNSKSDSILLHSRRVEEMSLKLGHEMNLSAEKLKRLRLAGQYHDMGKVAYPAELLNSEMSNLTPEELNQLQRHPKTGYQISKELHHLKEAAKPILHHHEWWNGTGYPQGVEGEEIPLLSRIVSLADRKSVV